MKKYQLVTLNYQTKRLSDELSKNIAALFNWMVTLEQTEVSLASIKKQFPEWRTVSTDSDILVSQGILERYDRRYRFKINYFNSEQWLALETDLTLRCQELIASLKKNDLMSLACLLEFSEVSRQGYVLVASELIDYLEYSILKTDNFIFVDNQENFGYASYFKQEEKSTTAVSQVVSDLLGDVNPYYLGEMIGKIVTVLNEKGVNHKIKQPNIFARSLELFDYLSLENNEILWSSYYYEIQHSELEQSRSRFKADFKCLYDSVQSNYPNLATDSLELLLYHHLMKELSTSKKIIKIKPDLI